MTTARATTRSSSPSSRSRSPRSHGIEGNHLERIRIAALLHDVGKIAVPDAILHKPAALARSEQALMRDHVAVGADILIAAGFLDEASWVLHHHENYDGTGYPERLSRRGDPARGADHLGRGRVRGDDGPAPVSRAD